MPMTKKDERHKNLKTRGTESPLRFRNTIYFFIFGQRALNDLASNQIGGAYSKGALARVVTIL